MSIANKKNNFKRLIVGATGASGMPILAACLAMIREYSDYSICLILSKNALLTLEQEMPGQKESLLRQADILLSPDEIGAGPASGTYAAAGMLIVPCSMKTAAGICSGYTDNLILRAADVTVKEQRPLVLAARETPLSVIHLRNLYQLAGIPGVHIIPPMMTFYHNPQTIEDMTDHIAAKLLEPFGIECAGYRRWESLGYGGADALQDLTPGGHESTKK